MRILVTGGAGFIGSHSVERLVACGHDVLVVDDLSSGSLINLAAIQARIHVEPLDIRERRRLRLVFADFHPEAVLHLAAVASPPRSVEKPLETASINLTGSLEVLEAARLAGIQRFVTASSAAVYGSEPMLPCRETDLPAPASPYAAQKLAVEHHLQVYRSVYGLETCALRYFNVYGPRQVPTSPYSGVLSRLLNHLQKREPFEVFGDGRQTRDFISVLDIAEVNRQAVEGLLRDRTILNVGTGQSHSLLDVIRIMGSIVGHEPALRFLPPRPGDVRHSCASTSLLVEVLPSFTPRPLQKGLVELVLAAGLQPAAR